MKPLPLLSIQAPFACYNSSLPPAPPTILLHPVPVPHYFPQFFPRSSAPRSNVSLPLTPVSPWFHVSIFHLLLLSSSPCLYTILFFLLVFFLPFLDRTKMQSTNKCHLALTTGAKDWDSPWHSQEMCVSKTLLGSCKPCKRLNMNTFLRDPRGYKVGKIQVNSHMESTNPPITPQSNSSHTYEQNSTRTFFSLDLLS